MFANILILSYKNFAKTTYKCLESLSNQVTPTEIGCMVLDNGSPDNSFELLLKYQTQNNFFKLQQSSQNLGYAGGMNLLAKEVDSEWLILAGSDIIFPDGALHTFIEALKKVDPQIGIVGPLTNEAGTGQLVLFKEKDENDILEKMRLLAISSPFLISPLYRADFFCVAIRKQVWNRLGGLDLSYGKGYYEDFDFCMRALHIGYRCAMVENVFVFHQGSASFKSDPEQKKLLKENKKLFIKKFKNVELRHRRQDTYHVLLNYFNLPIEYLKDQKLQERINLRLEYLNTDKPRSPLKRWVWQNKINKLTLRVCRSLNE